MIKLFINTFRTVIDEYCSLDNDEQYDVSLFEKPKATVKTSTVKDGFHLYFHGVTIYYKLRYLIRDKVVKLLSNNDIFKCFLIQLIKL